MRPFTKAIFEREGKAIVGSRWTFDQVQQAYEKADDLLNYISEYKTLGSVREKGINRCHPGFEDGLSICLAKGVPNKAVQSLSLNVLGHLLEEGRRVLRSAVWVYGNLPDTFKNEYASSKQAFSRDRFFGRNIPESSFSPFRTGDNPVLIQDEKLSQKCANLYLKAYSKGRIPIYYAAWLNSAAGDKFSCETSWLEKVVAKLNKKLLGKSIPTHSLTSMKQNTL